MHRWCTSERDFEWASIALFVFIIWMVFCFTPSLKVCLFESRDGDLSTVFQFSKNRSFLLEIWPLSWLFTLKKCGPSLILLYEALKPKSAVATHNLNNSMFYFNVLYFEMCRFYFVYSLFSLNNVQSVDFILLNNQTNNSFYSTDEMSVFFPKFFFLPPKGTFLRFFPSE